MVGLALLYAHREVDINMPDVTDLFVKLPHQVKFVL